MFRAKINSFGQGTWSLDSSSVSAQEEEEWRCLRGLGVACSTTTRQVEGSKPNCALDQKSVSSITSQLCLERQIGLLGVSLNRQNKRYK